MKIDLRTIPDAEVSGIDLMDVDITLPAPEAEPQRQYYFMALLKQQLVPERAKKRLQRAVGEGARQQRVLIEHHL